MGQGGAGRAIGARTRAPDSIPADSTTCEGSSGLLGPHRNETFLGQRPHQLEPCGGAGRQAARNICARSPGTSRIDGTARRRSRKQWSENPSAARHNATIVRLVTGILKLRTASTQILLSLHRRPTMRSPLFVVAVAVALVPAARAQSQVATFDSQPEGVIGTSFV